MQSFVASREDDCYHRANSGQIISTTLGRIHLVYSFQPFSKIDLNTYVRTWGIIFGCDLHLKAGQGVFSALSRDTAKHRLSRFYELETI